MAKSSVPSIESAKSINSKSNIKKHSHKIKKPLHKFNGQKNHSKQINPFSHQFSGQKKQSKQIKPFSHKSNKQKSQSKQIKPPSHKISNQTSQFTPDRNAWNGRKNNIPASQDTTKTPPVVKSSKVIKTKRKRLADKKKRKEQAKKLKLEEKKRLDQDKRGGISKDILDPKCFNADVLRKNTTMGASKIFWHARSAILELLKTRDYRPCLRLLAAMIETCKFRTLAYWKVGEEIIRNCRPEELSLFLGSVVSGVRVPKNVPVWKEKLLHILNDQGYAAFMEQIESSVENNDSPPITKLVALVMYEFWEQMMKKTQDDIGKMHEYVYFLEEQLKSAYHQNPTDRFIISAYLKVLSVITNLSHKYSDSKTHQHQHQYPTIKQEPGIASNDRAIKIKQVVDNALQNEINDPELICTLLHYGSQELKDDMNFSSNVCSVDPAADARINFLPIMKSMKSILDTDPAYSSVIMERIGLIIERLEYGMTDSYTLDELDDLLNELERAPTHIRYNMMSFFVSIDFPLILEDLQLGVDDDDIIALDTLEFLKYKLSALISFYSQNTPSFMTRR